MDTEDNDKPVYDAFISFTRQSFAKKLPQQIATDADFAKNLRSALMQYRLPRTLRQESKFGHEGKKLSFFMDVKSNSGSGSVDDTLRKALSNSRFLIVICSASAASENDQNYVNKELDWWLQQRASLTDSQKQASILPIMFGPEKDEEIKPKAIKQLEASIGDGGKGMLHYDFRRASAWPWWRYAIARLASFLRIRPFVNDNFSGIVAALFGIDDKEKVTREETRRAARVSAFIIGLCVAVAISVGFIYSRALQRQIGHQETIVREMSFLRDMFTIADSTQEFLGGFRVARHSYKTMERHLENTEVASESLSDLPFSSLLSGRTVSAMSRENTGTMLIEGYIKLARFSLDDYNSASAITYANKAYDAFRKYLSPIPDDENPLLASIYLIMARAHEGEMRFGQADEYVRKTSSILQRIITRGGAAATQAHENLFACRLIMVERLLSIDRDVDEARTTVEQLLPLLQSWRELPNGDDAAFHHADFLFRYYRLKTLATANGSTEYAELMARGYQAIEAYISQLRKMGGPLPTDWEVAKHLDFLGGYAAWRIDSGEKTGTVLAKLARGYGGQLDEIGPVKPADTRKKTYANTYLALRVNLASEVRGPSSKSGKLALGGAFNSLYRLYSQEPDIIEYLTLLTRQVTEHPRQFTNLASSRTVAIQRNALIEQSSGLAASDRNMAYFLQLRDWAESDTLASLWQEEDRPDNDEAQLYDTMISQLFLAYDKLEEHYPDSAVPKQRGISFGIRAGLALEHAGLGKNAAKIFQRVAEKAQMTPGMDFDYSPLAGIGELEEKIAGHSGGADLPEGSEEETKSDAAIVVELFQNLQAEDRDMTLAEMETIHAIFIARGIDDTSMKMYFGRMLLDTGLKEIRRHYRDKNYREAAAVGDRVEKYLPLYESQLDTFYFRALEADVAEYRMGALDELGDRKKAMKLGEVVFSAYSAMPARDKYSDYPYFDSMCHVIRRLRLLLEKEGDFREARRLAETLLAEKKLFMERNITVSHDDKMEMIADSLLEIAWLDMLDGDTAAARLSLRNAEETDADNTGIWEVTVTLLIVERNTAQARALLGRASTDPEKMRHLGCIRTMLESLTQIGMVPKAGAGIIEADIDSMQAIP